MSIWINKFTSPGFSLCPRNLHQNINEYHTIYLGEIGIIYAWEVVEGMDHPIKMGRTEFDTSSNMNKVGLVIHLTRDLWTTGKTVVMSSLYLLKGILEMTKRGSYVIVLIKIDAIILGGFTYIELMSTSVQNN